VLLGRSRTRAPDDVPTYTQVRAPPIVKVPETRDGGDIHISASDQVDEAAELAAWIGSPACSVTTDLEFGITGDRAAYWYGIMSPLPRRSGTA
jgi:hypothetical protein